MACQVSHQVFPIILFPRAKTLTDKAFYFRENMLPSFVSRRLAEKILSVGKSINFLRDICLNTKGYDGRNEIRQILEDSPGTTVLDAGLEPLFQIAGNV